jgi:hypothetical protein
VPVSRHGGRSWFRFSRQTRLEAVAKSLLVVIPN